MGEVIKIDHQNTIKNLQEEKEEVIKKMQIEMLIGNTEEASQFARRAKEIEEEMLRV